MSVVDRMSHYILDYLSSIEVDSEATVLELVCTSFDFIHSSSVREFDMGEIEF